MTLHKQQLSNVRKTWLLMTGFFLVVIIIGFVLTMVYRNPNILYMAIAFSLVTNIFAYWFSDKLVLKMAHAKKIEGRDDYPEFFNVMENLSATAKIPMPKLYIIDDPAPNAFATGRNKHHAVVAVTTGLLPLLTKSELEGVLAHEIAHINNNDMLIQTIVVVFAGMISLVGDMAFYAASFGGDRDEKRNPFFAVIGFLAIMIAPIAATLIKFAVSREREFLADATSVTITKYPEGLASALQKISNFHQPMRVQNATIAHLFITDPSGINDTSEVREHEKISFLHKLFMTHPPVQDRIDALLAEKKV